MNSKIRLLFFTEDILLGTVHFFATAPFFSFFFFFFCYCLINEERPQEKHHSRAYLTPFVNDKNMCDEKKKVSECMLTTTSFFF